MFYVFNESGYTSYEDSMLQAIVLNIELGNQVGVIFRDGDPTRYKYVDGKVVQKTINELGYEGLIPMSEYKAWKFNMASGAASNSIYAKYPLWKQNTVSADKEYAVFNVASTEKSDETHMTSDEVFGVCAAKITVNDIISLKRFIEYPDDISYTDILSLFPSGSRDLVKRNLQRVTLAICVFLLIKNVREWCNVKQELITAAETKEEIHEISLEDVPVI